MLNPARRRPIEQIGTPLKLYDRPGNAFVAGFIGSLAMNFIAGRLELDGDAPLVRTDDGLQLPLPGVPAGAEHGSRVFYGAPTRDQQQRHAAVGAAFRERVDARPGDRIALRPQAGRAHLFNAGCGRRLAQ